MSEFDKYCDSRNFDCNPSYDLCEVTFFENGVPHHIICEGFKFDAKLNAERKKNSACYEGYDWKLSNIEYDWELTAPCDNPWFDRRFKNQLCDHLGLTITGYVLTQCDADGAGTWQAKETLTGCIITDLGREYGEGVTRTVKGQALHHKILTGDGVVSKSKDKLAGYILDKTSPAYQGLTRTPLARTVESVTSFFNRT